MDSQQRKINEFYPWSAESNLTNQFILCLDNNAFSGDFILNETIIKLLRDSQNVYLISTNHSRNHYEAIFKKNALDLRQLEQAGRICIHFLLVGDDQAKAAWKDLTSWQSTGMRFPSKEDSPQDCPVVKECAFNIIIDDLDALEMIAPDSRAARLFMSKLIQSLNISRKAVSSSSDSSYRPEIIAVVDDRTSSNKNYNSIRSDIDIDAVQGSYKGSVINENNINDVNRNTEGYSVSPSIRILTLAAYGRESPNSSSSSESSNAFHSHSNSFFPSAVHISCLSSSMNSYEPTLSEYCRYRSDVTVSVCALASGFSSEVHGLCTVTTCSTSNQVGNKSNNTRGQTSGRNNGKNNSIKGNSNDDNKNNNNNSSDNNNNNNDNDNNNNNESASAKGIQERESKVSKNMNLRSATHKQVIHYKALDSGVKGCLSNNV